MKFTVTIPQGSVLRGTSLKVRRGRRERIGKKMEGKGGEAEDQICEPDLSIRASLRRSLLCSVGKWEEERREARLLRGLGEGGVIVWLAMGLQY